MYHRASQGWSLRSTGLRETQVRNAQCLQPGWFDQRRAAKICNFDLPLGVGAGRHENVGGLQVRRRIILPGVEPGPNGESLAAGS